MLLLLLQVLPAWTAAGLDFGLGRGFTAEGAARHLEQLARRQFLAERARPAVPTGLDMPLLQALVTDLGENEAISPFVMSSLMTQVYLGAAGTTRDEVGEHSVRAERARAALGILFR